MSRKYEKRKSESTYDALVELRCDLCGRLANGNDWAVTNIDATETEVRLKEGYSHSDGGAGTETTIDICPTCFKEKLIPFVESFGGRPQTTEWDY